MRSARPVMSSLVLAALVAVSIAGPGQALAAASGSASGGSTAAAPLTNESFAKLMKADEKLTGLTPRDRNLELATAASGNQDAIETWKRRFTGNPKVAEALKAAGMTESEYFETLVSLLQATAVSDYKKLDKPAPESLAKRVPASNLAFVRSHQPEISSWMQRSGTPQVHPNTIEDMYAAQASQPPATGDPASANSQAPAQAPAPGAAKKSPTKQETQPAQPK